MAAGCSRKPQPPLARAAEHLWNHQSRDGGWRSRKYASLKSGQALTPFVLDALLEVPPSIYRLPSDQLERAIRFIRSNTNAQGALGMMNPSQPEYPNYATAIAVSAICRAKRAGWEKQIQPMLAYLRRMQFSEQNGWKPEDARYGAWGVDLSTTRYVLEGLRAAGVPADAPVFARALIFVQRCQNYDPDHPKDADGGFFASPTDLDSNKAGKIGLRFRSYGTATADGILALIAIGRTLDDRRLRAAQNWLISHHRDMAAPGFVGERRWSQGLAFYYSDASSQAFRELGAMLDPTVAGLLERTQRRDGSWMNAEGLAMEDEPLIATALALRALAP